MGLFETEGLILKTYNLADADKIVILLTRDAGLIKGVAKGAKRLKSKFGSSLEPFSIVQVTCFQKEQNELVAIQQIDLRQSFFNAASQISFLQKFSYLSDLLINFAPPHDPNLRLYRMSKICLETANEKRDSIDQIAFYFEFWILGLGGYLPSWKNCRNCQIPFGQQDPAGLQINFQLACENCLTGKRNLIISSSQRYIYDLANSVSPARFVEMTKNREKDLGEVSNILKRIISQVLGKELRGEKIISIKN
jgi:DNA repair protein RecO (recombination protein O)